jgi:hypothetical protein
LPHTSNRQPLVGSHRTARGCLQAPRRIAHRNATSAGRAHAPSGNAHTTSHMEAPPDARSG